MLSCLMELLQYVSMSSFLCALSCFVVDMSYTIKPASCLNNKCYKNLVPTKEEDPK